MNSLVCGGAEKSLISLLETIDYRLYQVDLFLFRHQGEFMNKIPKQVHLLPEPANYKFFDMSFKKSVLGSIKKGNLKVAYSRCVLGYLAKTETNGAVIEQKLWKTLSTSLSKLDKKYDVAIGYLEKNPIYFCVDHVKARTKIGWIHTDFEKLGIHKATESNYFGKLNYVITVSDELVHILKRNFPQYKEKFICIHNIISPALIKSMAREKVSFRRDEKISILSVGRLAREKGLDIALEAIQILVSKGYDIHWYLIGEGYMRSELEKKINEYQLEDRVSLLGLKENPYPFMEQADIFLQTSRYEGKSISIEEAKILGKPIVITSFETASDHITHKKNGLIAGMNPESVAFYLLTLINNEGLRRSFRDHLNKEDYGTENEVNKLDQLMGMEGKQAWYSNC